MNRQNITLIISVFLLFLAETSLAQQDPTFTQYNFNTQSVNPAYVGTWESLGFMVLGRNQWFGIDGAPETLTLSIQSPTKNENVGLGLNVIADKIGREKKLSLYSDYSYRLALNKERTFLRFGLKFGISNYSNSLTAYVQDPTAVSDPLNQGDIESCCLLNFGVGAFLYSDKYYLGLSVPKMLENSYISDYTNYSSVAELRHFYLQGGYVFDLSEEVRFKPTFMARTTIGSPATLDVTANFSLKDKVWLGAMHRFGDSFGVICQWVFDEKLRIGYSIDFTVSELRHDNGGTHEVMISYELGYLKKWASPRMF